jgi:hypothetical protein
MTRIATLSCATQLDELHRVLARCVNARHHHKKDHLLEGMEAAQMATKFALEIHGAMCVAPDKECENSTVFGQSSVT